jgi:hypothetical protein
MVPRTNMDPEGSKMREKREVQPFPESRIVDFGFTLCQQYWSFLEDDMSSSEMIDRFMEINSKMVDAIFPKKTIQVGQGDLPYFTEELRHLKRGG